MAQPASSKRATAGRATAGRRRPGGDGHPEPWQGEPVPARDPRRETERRRVDSRRHGRLANPDRRRPPRRVPRRGGVRVRLLRPGRGDDGHPRGAEPPGCRPPYHDAPRAGRRLHGGRLRPPHRTGGGRDVDSGSRRDEPGHGDRRRLPGPGADGRPDRAGRLRQDPQGSPPVRGHRADAGAGDEVEPARRSAGRDPGDRAQGLPGGPAREARPDPRGAAGEHRGDGGGPGAPADRAVDGVLPGAYRRRDRARGTAAGRIDAPARARRQRRHPPPCRAGAPGVRPRAARSRRGDLHGQGRDRRSEPPVAHGRRPAGARPRALGLRPGRRRGVGRV